MVPLLIDWAKVPPHNANATSLAAIVPISIVGGLIYYFGRSHPAVDLHFAALLAVGSVVGAYLGARFSRRVPERVLLQAVAVLLAGVGLKEIVAP